MKRLILLSLLLLAFCQVKADESQVRVIALFDNSAMIDFNGQQKLYRVGQRISPTIKLVAADTQSAIIEVNGERKTLGLNRQTGFSGGANSAVTKGEKSVNTVQILKNNSGMFKTPGSINGVAVSFLVDTGASQVAMNESVARQVGLLYRMNGVRAGVATAAGNAEAWMVNLKKVRVGSIELKNVEALVIKGTGPNEVLLGMSFLGRLKMENEGMLLKLTKKY